MFRLMLLMLVLMGGIHAEDLEFRFSQSNALSTTLATPFVVKPDGSIVIGSCLDPILITNASAGIYQAGLSFTNTAPYLSRLRGNASVYCSTSQKTYKLLPMEFSELINPGDPAQGSSTFVYDPAL